MAVEADVKALEKRVKYLEELVKTIVATRSESKGEAARMLEAASKVFEQKTQKAMQGAQLKARESGVSPEELHKLQEASEKRAVAAMDLRLKAQAALAKAQSDKATAELNAQAKAQIEAAIKSAFTGKLETRLTLVEKLVQAALAKP